MGQYLLIPFLVGWTSIYQLFWGSLGTRVLTHCHLLILFLDSYGQFQFGAHGTSNSMSRLTRRPPGLLRLWQWFLCHNDPDRYGLGEFWQWPLVTLIEFFFPVESTSNIGRTLANLQGCGIVLKVCWVWMSHVDLCIMFTVKFVYVFDSDQGWPDRNQTETTVENRVNVHSSVYQIMSCKHQKNKVHYWF